MAVAEDDEDGGCECSSSVSIIIIKFLLFLTNFLVWLLGSGLLALGIYIQIEESSEAIQQALQNVSRLLTNPAIALIIFGAFLFIIGFCGCLGALLEVFILLVLYSILLALVILGEIALVTYIYLEQDQAYAGFELILRNDIEDYYSDLSVRDIIDLIQRDLLQCCGINSPDDWQINVYYNCSSVAFQRCSVPASCCVIEQGQVINLQCGYRTLDETAERYLMGIHSTGCLEQVRKFVNNNLVVILGAGGGLLVFQIFGLILSVSLSVIVRREKVQVKALNKGQGRQNLTYIH